MADLREQTDMTERTCEFDDKPVVGRGWCRRHYTNWYRHGDPLHGENLLPRGTAGVYSITCLANGWVYIGSSYSVRQRWTTHKSWLRNGTHTIPQLQADWDAHGEAAFVFEMVSIVKDEDERFLREQEHITTAIATGKCYNLSPSSRNNSGHRFSPEQSRRLSEAMTGKPKSAEHRANLWMNREVTPEFREQMADNGRQRKGKSASATTRARMSKAQRGSGNPSAKVTEEQVREIWQRRAAGEKLASLSAAFGLSQAVISQIASGKRWAHATEDLRRGAAISTANKGRPKSAEHRAKLGDAHRALWEGKEITPEFRAQMAELASRGKGQAKSEEHKRKISEAQKGRPKSPEHLANLRAAGFGASKPLKLTAEQIPEIRRRLAAGESMPSIAAAFGVKPASISDIKHGRSWRHIT